MGDDAERPCVHGISRAADDGESTPRVPIPLLLAISAAALLAVAPVTRRLLRIAPIDTVGAKE
ncbi:hypothetical protein [Embleya sp. NPDC005575]|uniref:hypothetical protein n=1 Tax=Embleya sp. NPDC005575 TaxID=3156892 RepID=UPI0033A847F7